MSDLEEGTRLTVPRMHTALSVDDVRSEVYTEKIVMGFVTNERIFHSSMTVTRVPMRVPRAHVVWPRDVLQGAVKQLELLMCYW